MSTYDIRDMIFGNIQKKKNQKTKKNKKTKKQKKQNKHFLWSDIKYGSRLRDMVTYLI